MIKKRIYFLFLLFTGYFYCQTGIGNKISDSLTFTHSPDATERKPCIGNKISDSLTISVHEKITVDKKEPEKNAINNRINLNLTGRTSNPISHPLKDKK